MNTRKKIFIISMPIIMAICSLFLICDYVDAAPRTAVRGTPATARKSVTVKNTATQQQNVNETGSEPVAEESEPVTEEINIVNKSNQFDVTIDSVMESATPDNSFAEMIRKQRAALAASESDTAVKSAMKSGKNSCDSGLRECMMKTCGNDFTKCALDGDTIFGDKLNKCRRDTECSGEEFRLFTAEIKADRDMNVKLASYNAVLNCGNSYNACIVNECGTTYTKCLGKASADAAIQKCSTIAKDCMEYDSGLASRIGVITGKLRENAEKNIKQDEEKLYAMRDKMKQACTSMGAMFDERTFDCVYTVNFFAGDNQTTPMASRKRYAGDTFICMQEWFGVNTTTYKENAYRETRAQTGASSAMLGSGVGTAVGLFSSGAIGRALDTQNAKKAVKEECEKDTTKEWKNGKCETKTKETSKSTPAENNNPTVIKPETEDLRTDMPSQEELDARTKQRQADLDAVIDKMAQKETEAQKTQVPSKQPSAAEIQQQIGSLEFSNQINSSKETTQRIAILKKMYEDAKKKEDTAKATINQATANAGLNIPLGR